MISNLIISTLLVGQLTAMPIMPPPPPVPVVISAPSLGKVDAPIKVEEFEDFQCPFCSQFAISTLPSIKKDYIDTGKVYFVHRDFPLEFHANSRNAAEAAQCANAQGLFWQFTDYLYKKQDQWAESTKPILLFRQYFRKAKGHVGKFNQCMTQQAGSDSAIYFSVNSDIEKGVAAGVQGTPSFLINGKLLQGAMPYATFQSIFEAELAGKTW